MEHREDRGNGGDRDRPARRDYSRDDRDRPYTSRDRPERTERSDRSERSERAGNANTERKPDLNPNNESNYRAASQVAPASRDYPPRGGATERGGFDGRRGGYGGGGGGNGYPNRGGYEREREQERDYNRPLDRRAIEEGRRRREEERAMGVVYTDDKAGMSLLPYSSRFWAIFAI